MYLGFICISHDTCHIVPSYYHILSCVLDTDIVCRKEKFRWVKECIFVVYALKQLISRVGVLIFHACFSDGGPSKARADWCKWSPLYSIFYLR